MPRKWEPRELRLLSEWLALEHPNDQYMTRVRLGRIQPRQDGQFVSTEEERMLGIFRRWADAIIITPTQLILVEAAIRPDPGKVGQLQLYKSLLPNTPELEQYQHLPVEMLILYAIPDDALIAMARSQGIKCVQYRPAWVEDYLKELFPRERRSPHTPL